MSDGDSDNIDNNDGTTTSQQQQQQSLAEYITNSLNKTASGSHVYTIFVLPSKPILTTVTISSKNKKKKRKTTKGLFHKKLLILVAEKISNTEKKVLICGLEVYE